MALVTWRRFAAAGGLACALYVWLPETLQHLLYHAVGLACVGRSSSGCAGTGRRTRRPGC
jgi:hypothetical protein